MSTLILPRSEGLLRPPQEPLCKIRARVSPNGQLRGGERRLFATLKRILIGRPLPTSAARGLVPLGVVAALPRLSIDSLSAAPVALQEGLVILAVAGHVSDRVSLAVVLAAAGLLVALAMSARRMVSNGDARAGGSYSAARGIRAERAAGALMVVSVVLNVAVAVAAVAQLVVSVITPLRSHQVLVAIVTVTVIAILHLRGESDRLATALRAVFYTFVLLVALTVLVALLTPAAGGDLPSSPSNGAGHDWLATASALVTLAVLTTGVETAAVEAGELRLRRGAEQRLVIIHAVLVAALAVGLWAAAASSKIVPTVEQPLLSRLGAEVWGRHTLIDLSLQAASVMLLVGSCLVVFGDFPRLAVAMAARRHAPRQFLSIGDRLTHSNGVLALSVLIAAVLAATRGRVGALVFGFAATSLLYVALGQFGLAASRRSVDPGWILSAGCGFAFAILGLFTLTYRFNQGGWLIVLAVPSWLLSGSIDRHYRSLDALRQFPLSSLRGRVKPAIAAVVPVADVSTHTVAAVEVALSLRPTHLVAVHFVTSLEEQDSISREWADSPMAEIPLDMLYGPYRDLERCLLSYFHEASSRWPDETIYVVISELVHRRRWHFLLHRQTALRLRAHLQLDSRFVVISVPYQVG